MKPLAALADLWTRRTPRERAMIVGLLFVAVVFSAHRLLYQPLLERHERALERFVAAERDHLWLQNRAQTIIGLRSSVRGAKLAGVAPGELRKIFSENLKKNGLQAELNVIDQEEGTKQIEIQFSRAAGKDVMRWIEQRVNDGHLLQRLRVEAGDKGQVSATAYFER